MVNEIKYIFIVLVLKKMTFKTYIDQHVENYILKNYFMNRNQRGHPLYVFRTVLTLNIFFSQKVQTFLNPNCT
jgi:hypothetical protein